MAMRVLSTRLIWPAPTPSVARFFAMTMALLLTCLATRKAKMRSPHSCSLGWRLVATVISSRSSTVAVLVLDEDAADDALVVELAGVRLAALVVAQDADVGLALQDLERLRLVAGREQHLDEELGEALGERHVDGAVDGDDAAEGADGVARVAPCRRRRRGSRRGRSRRGCCA